MKCDEPFDTKNVYFKTELVGISEVECIMWDGFSEIADFVTTLESITETRNCKETNKIRAHVTLGAKKKKKKLKERPYI